MRTTNREDLDRKRQQAKVGMIASLGALVATGLMARMGGSGAEGARSLHLCSGLALAGFSYWHLTLYGRPQAAKGRIA